jgi:hypothetical protein
VVTIVLAEHAACIFTLKIEALCSSESHLTTDQLSLIGFLWFFSALPGKCQGTFNQVIIVSFQILSISLFINHFII